MLDFQTELFKITEKVSWECYVPEIPCVICSNFMNFYDKIQNC